MKIPHSPFPIPHSAQKGFTMLELVVVIGIFSMLTGVVLSNYRSFDTNAKLANAVEDVVLALRQAQVYGVGAKGNASPCPTTGTAFDCSYGVHFQLLAHGITIFSDNNNDKIFTTGEDIGFEGTAATWVNSIRISNLVCNGNSCTGGTASVTFKRPTPDAFIAEYAANPPTSDGSLMVTLSDVNTGKTATVTITNAGQISIQ